jgi:hypothetical protein
MTSPAPGRTVPRVVAARRAIVVLIAALIGLGGLGGAVGAALGGTGAAAATMQPGGDHHHDGPGRAPRPAH